VRNGGLGTRQDDARSKSRGGVFQTEPSPVQRRDGGHDRETEAVAGQASATVETIEPLDDARPLSDWDAGAVVLDADRNRVSLTGGVNQDGRPAAGVFECVIEQVGDCARE
jgi:hypothetical protein